MTHRITLQPGDAVRLPLDDETYHAVGEAFIAAGAERGEFPRDGDSPDRALKYLGWKPDGFISSRQIFHGSGGSGWVARTLTPSEVINATNAREQTPAEAAGFRVGDRGTVTGAHGGFSPGERVELYRDDETRFPEWYSIDHRRTGFLRLSAVDPDPQGHPQADILREIADEAKSNPEFWRAFECRPGGGTEWRPAYSGWDLLDSVSSEWEVRRKPRTVRVEGELAREHVETLRSIESYPGAQAAIRAILELVDDA